ncbi:hypothetical protein [Spirillospora sp. CA-294931]|uniref:hypothetical protein n=1 Tax=Spirillospora sp. CA-294931 TaxID=3240042 RepID=UPI003D89B9BC
MTTDESPAAEGLAAVVRLDGYPPLHALFRFMPDGSTAVAVPCSLPEGEYTFRIILPDRVRRTGWGVAKPMLPGTILHGDLDQMTEETLETEPPFPERVGEPTP